MDIVPLEWRAATPTGERAAAARRQLLDGKAAPANAPLPAGASRTRVPSHRRRTL
ncbi:hypothetical protein [Kitasatospora sp. NPDC047058]|uniref:hypothetical protein n=1 Tax=Kitasatospora sp. NPDC047058 TaxID=3155620 RepID=UPI0033D0E1CB